MSTVVLGSHQPAQRTLIHLSDTHLLAGGVRLGAADTEANLRAALDRLGSMRPRPDAIIVTGDLTDRGEPEAYRTLRGMLEPVADAIGAELIWVAGNHDEREPMREHLLGGAPSRQPITGEWDLRGLRVLALDTSVPGWHHGDLDEAQLQWLAQRLATPAPLGTILAMHHPPLPSHVPLFDILELQHQDLLAAVLRGSDVRAILAGHLHYSTSGMFAGVPVSVASATCYTMDLGLPPQEVNGMDAGQAFHLVHVWEETVTHAVVPVASADPAATFTPEWYARMAALSPAQRLERFSRKPA